MTCHMKLDYQIYAEFHIDHVSVRMISTLHVCIVQSFSVTDRSSDSTNIFGRFHQDIYSCALIRPKKVSIMPDMIEP